MVVLSHADPVVRGNQIHGGHENGVWVVEHGQGQLLSNELYNNSDSEISISNGAAPTVRDNLIHHEDHLGIYTADAAGGSAKGNVGAAVGEDGGGNTRGLRIALWSVGSWV